MGKTHALNLATPGMATLCLYGDLQRFGRRFDLCIKTAAEGLHALGTQIPGFRQQIQAGWYQVRIAGEDVTPDNLSARLHEPLPADAIIHLVPRMAGAKEGGFLQVVAGAALIALAWWNPAGWFGASAIAGMYGAGAGLVLGGVAQFLTPQMKTPSSHQTDNGKASVYFSSVENRVAQGNPVPIAYGEVMTGSRVISQEITTRDESDGIKVVELGRRRHHGRGLKANGPLEALIGEGGVAKLADDPNEPGTIKPAVIIK